MSEISHQFRSAFTVDNVIFGFDEDDIKVLLIKRGRAPYLDRWALPGHFVLANETVEEAAARVLEELTGLKNVFQEEVGTFSAVNRHPNGRVITVAYYSLLKISHHTVAPFSFAKAVEWHSVKQLDQLAFDHNNIVQAGFEKLKVTVKIRPIGFELLPRKFTLTQLQHLYECILETGKDGLDKRNFRKKILSMNLLVELDESQEGVAHRPARLYRFDRAAYESLKAEGFSFELKESKRKK
ncbi:MAG: NUDIX domain-containing protein [Bacteroidota bacterium]